MIRRKRIVASISVLALATTGVGLSATTGAFATPPKSASTAFAADAGHALRASSSKPYTIALLNGDNEDPYFYSVWAGALATVKAAGDKFIEEAPATFDYTSQVPLFEDLLAKKVSGILLSADGTGNTFNSELAQAKKDHIPVVIVNETEKDMNNNPNALSFITSSNTKLSELAGKEICTLLHGKGTVGILNSSVTVISDLHRVTGLQAYVKADCPGVTLLPQEVTQDDISTAQSDATDLIESHPNLSLLYGVDDFNAVGILTALKDTHKAGKIKEVAIDAEPQEVAGLRAGVIQALVAQQPYLVGQTAAKYILDALTGHASAIVRSVSPPGIVLTPANINNPKYKDVPYRPTLP